MPMTNPGGAGGASVLSGLSDVSVIEGTGIDGAALTFNAGTSKWNAGVPSSPTFNPTQTSSFIMLSNQGLTASDTNNDWSNALTTVSGNEGKYYCEALIATLAGGTGVEFGIANTKFDTLLAKKKTPFVGHKHHIIFF